MPASIFFEFGKETTMVIKNIGGKIISFGNVMILPGNSAEVGDKFVGASNVAELEALGFIKVEKEMPSTDEPHDEAHEEAKTDAEPVPVKKRPAKAKVAE